MYGYIDESGIPGVKKTEQDYLGLALVLFENRQEVQKATEAIKALKEKLSYPKDQEFHASKDSLVTCWSFLGVAAGLDFHYIYVSIHKNTLAAYATYENLASRLIAEIRKHNIEFRSLKMDDNPVLFAALRKYAKENGVYLRCKQVKSSNYELIQLADYIVCFSTRKLRGKAVGDNWSEIERKKL